MAWKTHCKQANVANNVPKIQNCSSFKDQFTDLAVDKTKQSILPGGEELEELGKSEGEESREQREVGGNNWGLRCRGSEARRGVRGRDHLVHWNSNTSSRTWTLHCREMEIERWDWIGWEQQLRNWCSCWNGIVAASPIGLIIIIINY